jgi:hypothetical protein
VDHHLRTTEEWYLSQSFYVHNTFNKLKMSTYGMTQNTMVHPGTERHQAKRTELERNQKGNTVGRWKKLEAFL